MKYWEKRKKAYGNQARTTIILATAKDLNISDDCNNQEIEIDEELQKSYSKLRKIQEQDQEFRVEYLLDLANKYSQENNISKEKAI